MNFNFDNFKAERTGSEKSKRTQEIEKDYFRIPIDMDNEQINVIESKYNSFLVTGPAGSGKTILASAKFKELERLNENYIFIIYTKALKEFIEGKMLSSGFHDSNNKIFYAEELKSKDKDTYNFLEIANINPNYIIVDEAQDFSLDQIKELKSYINSGIFLYGDDIQHLYPKQTNFKNTLPLLTEENIVEKHYDLDTIYRFSKQIFDFANNIAPFSSVPTFVRPQSRISDSDIPMIIEFNTFHEEMQYIKNVIETNSWQNVAILMRKGTEVANVYNWFRDNTNNTGPFERIQYKDHKDNTLNFSSDLNKLKILTYHSSKGLEFDRVFIPSCNVYEDEFNIQYNYRAALYVAFTRAKYSLIVSYNNECYNDNIRSKKIFKSPYLDEIDTDTYMQR